MRWKRSYWPTIAIVAAIVGTLLVLPSRPAGWGSVFLVTVLLLALWLAPTRRWQMLRTPVGRRVLFVQERRSSLRTLAIFTVLTALPFAILAWNGAPGWLGIAVFCTWALSLPFALAALVRFLVSAAGLARRPSA